MPLARFTLPILAVFAADTPYATVRTSGQFDADGTVLYSVYVATAGEKLDGVAVWSLKEIPANRLVGPFTFRARSRHRRIRRPHPDYGHR